MKRETRYRVACMALCLVVGLVGFGGAVIDDPEMSWVVAPMALAAVFLYGFAMYMFWNGGGK